MNLVWREFEKKCRALYREELKRSAELRQEVKRRRKSDGRIAPQLIRELLLPLFWCSIFLSIASKDTDLRLPAAAVALWAAGSAFRWGHQWFQQFYASEDLVVLNFLPLHDQQIFGFQLRRYLLSAGWLFWELSLAYLVFGLVEGANAPGFLLLLAAGILQALLVMALAIHLASWVHMVPLGTIGAFLRFTAIALLIFGARGVESTAYVTQATEWFLPTGWINYVLFRGAGDPFVFALLLPIGALIYLARYSFSRLRSFYSLAGVEIVPARSSAAQEEELTAENVGRRPGPTEIEDRVLARHFLAGLNWELTGALEKFMARCLSDRERVITEFLVAGNPGWTSSLKVSFWIWAVSCMVVLTLGQFSGTVVFFAAYVLATTSLPLFGGDWRGMRQSASGGMFLPAFSVYPISFNAIARIFLKVNLVRISTALPLIVTFGALAAYRLGQPPLSGVVVAAKLLAVLVCLQPLFVVIPISSTSNDTAQAPLWVKIFLLVPALILVVGAALAVFLSPSVGAVLASYVALLLFSVLVFAGYRRAYRRGRFDLLTERSSGRS